MLSRIPRPAVSEAVRIGGERKSGDATPKALRELAPRARRILSLFAKQERLTAQDVAKELGLSERMARVLVAKWCNEGILEVGDYSRRNRVYVLSRKYYGFIMLRNA